MSSPEIEIDLATRPPIEGTVVPDGTPVRRLELLRLSDLRPDPANPKDHDVALVGGSLERFGYIDTIVRDDRTGYLISGHGRAESLAQRLAAGESPPDGIGVAPDGDWLVPVVVGWASANDPEARAALITLNRSTEVGGWVDEALLALLDDLAGTDPSAPDPLHGVGFDDAEIALLRERVEALADRSFLDDLANQDGHNPFRAGTDLPNPLDEVTLSFACSVPERAAVMARLRAIRDASPQIATATQALLAGLGIETADA